MGATRESTQVPAGLLNELTLLTHVLPEVVPEASVSRPATITIHSTPLGRLD